jgi:DNA polymerase-1
MPIDPITIDFETEGIVGNPLVNPPTAVGYAVWVPGSEPTYLAWGHPTGNNVTYQVAREYLHKLFWSGQPLLFHNAGFDLSVAENEAVPFPWWDSPDKWKLIHDTMYLLFLADPYSATLSLKPSADRYLGMPAEEQTALYDWIVANIPEATYKTAGAFIAKAPGDLVGRYAIGDVVRTRKLFDLLHSRICELGMEAAYDRERRLFPITMEGTKRGIRINRDLLQWHEQVYTECHTAATIRLASSLNCPTEHLEKDTLLADALERAGAVTEWILTTTGKRSMSKDNLRISNPEIKSLMGYRSALETCLQTFMRPWLSYSAGDGRLHPNWNQVRTRGDLRDSGTRTGRLSSDSPNFQNVPTEFSKIAVPEGLHPLPTLRSYCLPEQGHVWLKRDFSSQEIRILAHFEDGSLCEAYRANPSLDPHQMAMDLIQAMIGVLYARKDIKITGFSIIYGSGARSLAVQLGQSYEEAYAIKEAYLGAMPGVRALMQDVQGRGRSGQPIRTWGGRLYYTEPSREIDGRMRDFAYKLLNYLIQGSAADQTKQALGDWNENRKWDAIFLATVHDEINISAPKETWQEHMATLKEAMNRDRFDVPFLSEGFVGENWHEIAPTEN